MARTPLKKRTGPEKAVMQFEKSANAKPKKKETVEWLDTGSTHLNFAISGKADGGWGRGGRCVNIVGDGSAGKTLLALEACAYVYHRMKKEHKLKGVKIVYNNTETVMDFPIELMYRLDAEKLNLRNTETIEAFVKDFWAEVKAIKKGYFLLYVVDSLDVLKSEAEKKAVKEDKKVTMDMYQAKPKKLHQFFRNLTSTIDDGRTTKGKDFCLILVSQTKEKIGETFKTKYRTGGSALDFYTHQVVWLRKMYELKKTINGRDWPYGVMVEAHCKRNKVAKPGYKAQFPILFDYGLDNVWSVVNFLYGPKAKEWEWDDYKTKDIKKFIAHVEENNLEQDLIDEMKVDWEAAVEKISTDRRKY